MCGDTRSEQKEPLVFTQSEVAAILDRTPVQTFTTPTGRTVTVLRSGEIIQSRGETS